MQLVRVLIRKALCSPFSTDLTSARLYSVLLTRDVHEPAKYYYLEQYSADPEWYAENVLGGPFLTECTSMLHPFKENRVD